jgi:drug/metabolite transporter (DMT)-like permease
MAATPAQRRKKPDKVESSIMPSDNSPRRLHVVIAFALVYVLWGSTYLAIRISVDHLTPLLMGGMRFTAAGLLMLGYRAALRTPHRRGPP